MMMRSTSVFTLIGLLLLWISSATLLFAADAFAPLPADVMCTQEFGGAQTATVRGSVDGTTVNATFARNNGCEISRWDRLVVLLGSAGGV